jgi:hypothetical protein
MEPKLRFALRDDGRNKRQDTGNEVGTGIYGSDPKAREATLLVNQSCCVHNAILFRN